MITVIGSVVAFIIVAAIFSITTSIIRKRRDKEEQVHLFDSLMKVGHRFESNSRKVAAYAKDGHIQKVEVQGRLYTSTQDALATEPQLSQEDIEHLEFLQESADDYRKRYPQPKKNAYREFRGTPLGSIRVYEPGKVSVSNRRVSDRLTVLIHKTIAGDLVVAEAYASNTSVASGDYTVFKVHAVNGVTADQAEKHTEMLSKFLHHNGMRQEFKDLNTLWGYLDKWNKFRKFVTVDRGRLIIDAEALDIVTAEDLADDPTVLVSEQDSDNASKSPSLSDVADNEPIQVLTIPAHRKKNDKQRNRWA